MQKYDILINPIAPDVTMGIYEKGKLVTLLESGRKASEAIPRLFSFINIDDTNRLIYVNGPGSYMAIKVAYTFLKTLSISKGFPLYGVSGFELNGNSPIKALGKKYFIKKGDDIVVDFYEGEIKLFVMPKKLDKLTLLENSEPNYILPAVED